MKALVLSILLGMWLTATAQQNEKNPFSTEKTFRGG